jgi:predicted aspartyl protease
MRSRHRAYLWAALLLLLVTLTGCGVVVIRQPSTTFNVSCAELDTGAAPQAVPAHVLHTTTATIVLVPVCLAGQGPYPFILDTGAAHTLVDRDVADRLHLVQTGATSPATGVACTAVAGQVQVPNWSVGQVPLRAQTLSSLSMTGSPGGPGIAGLLGSDVWSRFGQFRLDYRAGRLMLPGPEQATAPTAAAASQTSASPAPANRQVPMTVVHTPHGTLALVPVTLDGHDPLMFVLDTGSSTSVVDLNVARRFALPPVGRSQRATGVSCGTDTQPVHVRSWQVGPVDLPAQNLDGIALAIPGLTGLLGSDVLYRFGTITVDYAASHLVLEG